MGKTTSGQPTSENVPLWATSYNEFYEMYNNKTKAGRPIPFKLNEVYRQVIREQPDPVSEALNSLEKYYDMIESFLSDARSGRTAREDLADMVNEFCGDDMLDGYPEMVTEVLNALASIAEKVKAYSSSSSSSQLSSEEGRVLTKLLTTVNSISENVKRDFAAEVGGSWGAYVSARRRTLSAIAGI